MNLTEMAEQLPNGLHDAEIEEFTYNIAQQSVVFKVNVWIGTMDQPSSERERYRWGLLRFQGVEFFTKTESAYLSDSRMTFLTWGLQEDLEEKAKLSRVIAGKFFELSACYCQFRIACKDVSFEWTQHDDTNLSDKEN
ncbi:MAG TPA: hypothetical protein VGU46_06920 [Acidobacteriaceae bacterium]|nr:hypothetical protein [Acidobacteriaceae bacterium]